MKYYCLSISTVISAISWLLQTRLTKQNTSTSRILNWKKKECYEVYLLDCRIFFQTKIKVVLNRWAFRQTVSGPLGFIVGLMVLIYISHLHKWLISMTCIYISDLYNITSIYNFCYLSFLKKTVGVQNKSKEKYIHRYIFWVKNMANIYIFSKQG